MLKLAKIKYYLILIGVSIITFFGFLREYKKRIIADLEFQKSLEATKDMLASNKKNEEINEVVENKYNGDAADYCVHMQE
jgi:hypothetical protein